MKNELKMSILVAMSLVTHSWAQTQSEKPVEPAPKDGAVFTEVAAEAYVDASVEAYSGPLVTAMVTEHKDDRLTVEVFINGSDDLRAFQTAVVVTTDSRVLVPVDVWIDEERPDYVFRSVEAVTAADQQGGRIVGAMLHGGVNASRQTYLGSFAFELARNANRSVRVEILAGPATKLRDSINRPIEFRAISPEIVQSGDVAEEDSETKPDRGNSPRLRD